MQQQAGPGLRVLLVEDEALIAMYVEDLLTELGYQVVAAVGRLEDALRIATNDSFDIAVLDMNLGGELSHPVARVLDERGIPFVYVTGYGSACAGVPVHAPTLQKPFMREALQTAIRSALEAT